MNRISGPLLDRIDIHIEVTPVSLDKLSHSASTEPSEIIRKRVEQARIIQERRYIKMKGTHTNAQIPDKLLKQHCTISQPGLKLLHRAMEKMGLSARAYNRILKVARTISDLAGKENILDEHLAEAIHFRSLDRERWGL